LLTVARVLTAEATWRCAKVGQPACKIKGVIKITEAKWPCAGDLVEATRKIRHERANAMDMSEEILELDE
jgi:hypothetical protein